MDACGIFLIADGVMFLTALIGLIYQDSDRSSKKESGLDDGTGKKASAQFLKVGSNIRT
jgi:hypothetical protein